MWGSYSFVLSIRMSGCLHAEVPVGSGFLITMLSMERAHSLPMIATNSPLVEIVLAIDLGQSYWISCLPRTLTRSEWGKKFVVKNGLGSKVGAP